MEISNNFSSKKGRKNKKIKVRQKEEFQKEATKTFILREKMQKERKKKISQREETSFSPNNLTKWKEGETVLG